MKVIIIGFFICGALVCNVYANESEAKIDQKADWTLAMEKMTAYMDKYKNQYTRWIEIKSKFIDKYLPGYRAFNNRSDVFMLDQNGLITCIDKRWPGDISCEINPDSGIKTISDFLLNFKIPLKDAQTAVEMEALYKIVFESTVYDERRDGPYYTDEIFEAEQKKYEFQAYLHEKENKCMISKISRPTNPEPAKDKIDDQGYHVVEDVGSIFMPLNTVIIFNDKGYVQAFDEQYISDWSGGTERQLQ